MIVTLRQCRAQDTETKSVSTVTSAGVGVTCEFGYSTTDHDDMSENINVASMGDEEKPVDIVMEGTSYTAPESSNS